MTIEFLHPTPYLLDRYEIEGASHSWQPPLEQMRICGRIAEQH